MKSFIRRLFEHIKVYLNRGTTSIQAMDRNALQAIRRSYALLCHQFYWVHYRLSIWRMRHGPTAKLTVIILLVFASAYFSPVLQSLLKPLFSAKARLADLRSLFLALGGGLIGATAIAFSLVVFAMQVNIERMPYGLFRKVSKDPRIIGAFGGIFILAIVVACTSLIPDVSWVAKAVLTSGWGIFLIIVLFLYAYRRTLLLINPIKQLNLLVEDACHGMRTWSRRAKRAEPLFKGTNNACRNLGNGRVQSTHDQARMAYFQANPHWTTGVQQAIQHAISYSRRYAAQGDHEVSGEALSAIVRINRCPEHLQFSSSRYPQYPRISKTVPGY